MIRSENNTKREISMLTSSLTNMLRVELNTMREKSLKINLIKWRLCIENIFEVYTF